LGVFEVGRFIENLIGYIIRFDTPEAPSAAISTAEKDLIITQYNIKMIEEESGERTLWIT
jgi:hypothetical protein